MNRLIVALALAGTVSIAAGCTPMVTADDLYGDWVLVSGTDSTGQIGLYGADVTVTIKDKMIGGRVCNSFGGEFTGPASELTVGPLASTEMYCTEPLGIMDFETQFLADLDAVTSGALVYGQLVLTGPGITLEFDAAN